MAKSNLLFSFLLKFKLTFPCPILISGFALNSLTLLAYLKVFKVCSEQPSAGLIFAIIKVLQLPMKESLNTKVNLLPRKGVCFLSWSKALMHSFKANKDLFISAPSNFVCLFTSMVSAARSLPAKSIKEIFPKSLLFESFIFI